MPTLAPAIIASSSDAVIASIPLYELRNSNLDRRARAITNRFLQRRHVGHRRRDIALLHRLQIQHSLPTKALLEYLNVSQELHRLIVAYVVDPIWRLACRGIGRLRPP